MLCKLINSFHYYVAQTVEVEAGGRCGCAGRGGVCAACQSRAAPRAPRAGTQGYRPPEVLLKVPTQTTAVDIWAAGVVLASVLCARYPFLRAADDVSALAEVADLVGTRALHRAAAALGRRLLASAHRRPLCLRKLAARYRGATPPSAPPAHPCSRCPPPRAACLCRPDDEEVGRTENTLYSVGRNANNHVDRHIMVIMIIDIDLFSAAGQ